MSDLFELAGFCALTLLGTALILGLLAVPFYFIEQYSCSQKAEQMHLPSQYGLWTDCMIQYKGQWVPFKSFRSGVVE